MPARILIIGLDSYDQGLLREWSHSGELKTLGRLLQDATWGITEGPAAVYAGAVWPSFNTGTYPARHRRFFRRQAERGEYLDRLFTPLEIEGTPFWETLSTAGHRVAVVDVPHSKPASSLNGIQVVDWATHEPELEQASTYPASLRADIVQRFGVEPPDLCEEAEHSVAGYRALYAHLETRLRNKTAMSLEYLRSADWDLFITVFGEAHCAGHQWWHLHDPSHPRHDARLAAQTGDLMKDVYLAIDRRVGELIAAAGAPTRVIVVTTHGMGPLYGESVVFDEILRRLDRPAERESLSIFGRLKQAWYQLPPIVRDSAPAVALKARMQPSLQRSLLVPDRQARRFFAIPHNPHAGAVRINLAGREAHGIVRPGEEYRALCETLRRELLSLQCPQTGASAVEAVHVTAEIYKGPFLDELPDLLVQWKRDHALTGLSSPRVGTISIPTVPGRTGDHTREGIFLATGPGLSSRRLNRSVPIVDFAPTLCALLDTPPSDRVEGSVIPELTLM